MGSLAPKETLVRQLPSSHPSFAGGPLAAPLHLLEGVDRNFPAGRKARGGQVRWPANDVNALEASRAVWGSRPALAPVPGSRGSLGRERGYPDQPRSTTTPCPWRSTARSSRPRSSANTPGPTVAAPVLPNSSSSRAMVSTCRCGCRIGPAPLTRGSIHLAVAVRPPRTQDAFNWCSLVLFGCRYVPSC